MQDGVLEGLQLEISERPTTKQLEDLRKQVKILQVIIVIKNGGHSLNQHYNALSTFADIPLVVKSVPIHLEAVLRSVVC